MWAQHCLAHVYSGDFRIDEGINAMEDFAPSWKSFGRYIQAHNWFHLGALYIAKLQYDRALDGYHRHIWGFNPDLVVEQTDAILLLWYLELAGANLDAGCGKRSRRTSSAARWNMSFRFSMRSASMRLDAPVSISLARSGRASGKFRAIAKRTGCTYG